MNREELLIGLNLREIHRSSEESPAIDEACDVTTNVDIDGSDDPNDLESDSLEPDGPVDLVIVTPPDCQEDVYLDDSVSEIRADDSDGSEIDPEPPEPPKRKRMTAKRASLGIEHSYGSWASTALLLRGVSNGKTVERNGSACSSPGIRGALLVMQLSFLALTAYLFVRNAFSQTPTWRTV